LRHFDACIGLNTPQQVRTTPGSKAMAAGRIPHEANGVSHGVFSITCSYRTMDRMIGIRHQRMLESSSAAPFPLSYE